MKNFLSLLLVVLVVVVTLLGDTLLKIAGTKKILGWEFFLGMFLFWITAVIWFFVLKETKLSIANSIYSILTILLAAAIGVLRFNETITTKDIVGIILAISSIIVLYRFN